MNPGRKLALFALLVGSALGAPLEPSTPTPAPLPPADFGGSQASNKRKHSTAPFRRNGRG